MRIFSHKSAIESPVIQRHTAAMRPTGRKFNRRQLLRRIIMPATLIVLTAVIMPGAGCIGYRLGSTLPPDIQSIFIHTFGNRSGEPLVEFELTNTTIEEFQRDGTLRIARIDDADIILECSLRKITLEPLRYDRVDRSKPNEYRLHLDVLYVLKRARTQEIMDEGNVEGETTFVFAGNLTMAKKDAIPRAAEDMAKNLVEKVVEVW